MQDVAPTLEQNRVLHRTIQAVTQDIERMSFNTAIARMMEFTNFFLKCDVRPRVAMEQFVLLLSPFAPHLAEELWQLLGHAKTLAYEPWPDVRRGHDPRGHGRDSRADQRQAPRPDHRAGRHRRPTRWNRPRAADPRIAELLAGKTVVKAIVVPGKMVNFVVK